MLKCSMIFNRPKEYYELYDSFKDGGTLREWINMVEQLSARIVDHTPAVNIILLSKHITNGTVEFNEGAYYIRGNKKTKLSDELNDAFPLGSFEDDAGTRVISAKKVERFLYSDAINKFKGDMLEVLSEIFFAVFVADEGVGLRDYVPVDLGSDFGVDATATNVNGHHCAVQVKYRSNPFDLISYADIARTFTSAFLQMGISDVGTHDHTVYLFTISNGVTGAFTKVMGRKCVVIPKGIISTKIDNNKAFWKQAFDLIYTTMK